MEVEIFTNPWEGDIEKLQKGKSCKLEGMAVRTLDWGCLHQRHNWQGILTFKAAHCAGVHANECRRAVQLKATTQG